MFQKNHDISILFFKYNTTIVIKLLYSKKKLTQIICSISSYSHLFKIFADDIHLSVFFISKRIYLIETGDKIE